MSMIKETRQSLADCIFYWSCQKSFTKMQTQTLLGWTGKNMALDSDGRLDGCGLAVLMAVLYAIDVSVLDNREDGKLNTVQFT